MQHRLARKPVARRLVVLRRQRHAADERTNVKPGAAGDDGALTACANAVECCKRIVRILGSRIPLPRVEEADQMMRGRSQLFG